MASFVESFSNIRNLLKSYGIFDGALIDETIDLFCEVFSSEKNLLPSYSELERVLVTHPRYEKIRNNISLLQEAVDSDEDFLAIVKHSAMAAGIEVPGL